MPNRLQWESSPYLLQHAENPVDWYPWGSEAFARAKAEDKPVLLSIGYSACHWCHVMAHESFENESIASLMNEHFINIKVDREERPDVDHVYMSAVQTMVGGGGWPLTVFLTPDGKPFYGGTYFPAGDGLGMPGFPRILKAVSEAYRTRRADVKKTVANLEEALSTIRVKTDDRAQLTVSLLDQAYHNLIPYIDRQNGGFGTMPKFPQPHLLEFILRYHLRTGDAEALDIVEETLQKMACGGIYDQLGGGFHRYSTDAVWLVPHFEKMLYDNALLSALYLHAFQITGNVLYSSVVQETLDYVLAEMTAPSGGFFSSEDADSEGAEGKYYVWSEQEIDEVLGPKLSSLVKQYYHVTTKGNFEGANILYRSGDDRVADPVKIEKARRMLLQKRRTRIRQGKDDKILSGWNGLMIVAMAEAGCALERKDYLDAAVACGTFIDSMMTIDGVLMHSWKEGRCTVNGYLQDYAFVIAAYLALHKTTLDFIWLARALNLAESLVQQFWDEGTLYDAGNKHDRLFIRSRQLNDDAMPAGISSAVMVLMQIAGLTSEERYRTIAVQLLGEVSQKAVDMPLGFAWWLCGLDFYLAETLEIAVIGSLHNRQTQELARSLFRYWLPNAIVAAYDPSRGYEIDQVPVLAHKTPVDDRTTLYLCKGRTCMEPLTEPESVSEVLKNLALRSGPSGKA